MKRAEIEGGATLWARQTIESDIFTKKPSSWFKIWFYLVNRVSHKDTKKYERGETYLHYDWVCESVGCTKDQLKKCLAYLRKSGMVSTRRSTRGVWLKVTKYSYFQELDNYYYNVKAPDLALEKHQRSTREAPRYNKNDKNDKNILYSSKNPKNKPYKDFDKFRLNDGTLAVLQWGKWKDANNTNLEIDFNSYKELPTI